MINPKITIIGNLAFDCNHYLCTGKSERHLGGACLYSAVSGSLFYPVRIISKTGFDYDFSMYTSRNLDFSNVRKLDEIKTNVFNNYIKSQDGSDRIVVGNVPDEFIVCPSEISEEVLKNSTHIHFTTNHPTRIVNVIEHIKSIFPNIILSIDTIEDFACLELTRYLYDIVDIAFIDDTYQSLLDCKAPIHVIKHGKYGCSYQSDKMSFFIKSNILENVTDPIGAGDCLNGVLITLLAYGVSPKKALCIANRVATEFVQDYGIYSLTKKVGFINENKKYLGESAE